MPKVLQELNVKDSIRQVQKLLKNKRGLKRSDFVPGNILFMRYSAKYKNLIYDKTPLVLLLKVGSVHTLGLNFHWLPFNKRKALIRIIIGMNIDNLRKNKPLKFTYGDLKPYLKYIGFVSCVRLYINSRISRTGVVIPPDRILDVAIINTKAITNGRPAEYYFRLANLKMGTNKRVKKNQHLKIRKKR